MGDHHHGGAGAVEPEQQLHHAFARCAVERAGGLVGQQQQRPARQGAGDGGALLLAARELVWTMLEPMRQPDLGQRGCRPLAPFAERGAGVEQAVGDIVERRDAG